MRLFCSLVFMTGGVFASMSMNSASGQTTPTAAPPDSGQRIILRVNRNTEVVGYLSKEDDDVIEVRTLKGVVESLPKSRIMQIIRLVDPAPDQTGIVVMRDGQVREGVIIEDAFEHVLVDIHGIRAKLMRDVVSHVVLQPTFEKRYAEYKAALQPGMYDAHLSMCRWLVDEKRYDLAQQELEDLLDKVEMPEAKKLLTLVNAQLALASRPHAPTPAAEPSTPPVSEESLSEDESKPSASDSDQLVTEAEVNLIRVYEIDFDHPPKITISPDTIRTIIDQYGTNRLVPASQTGRNAMFRAASDQPLEIVRLMFELRARDLYSQIQVNSEPHALNQFRLRVHDTWLMNNCATSRCHGGPDAGALFLHRKNHKNERVRYTNFLILERLKIDPQWPLINYERPEDSLIIQYGLSREDPTVRKPHPRVPGWKPAFSPINPRMKQDSLEWIRSMMQPRPEYPIEFDPNRHAPITENPRPER